MVTLSIQGKHVQVEDRLRFRCTMKTNLIALTLLALAGIFLAGCANTSETTTTETTTRSQGVQYGR